MATVETVTGSVDASELGTTLIHEHLRTQDEAVHAQWPSAGAVGGIPERATGPGEDYDAAVEAANAAIELGVKTICDPTAMFLGRDVDFMRRVAEQTGLQVVPCTGIYTYDHLPPFFVSRTPEQIADMFVADIEEGIQGTDIKAAFIKCAADEPGVNERIEKIHRAAARASLRTGAPIMAHSRPASDTGPRQVEILLEEGVAPEKIQIAHTGDSDDLDYIQRLLDKGVYIGMDRYGLPLFLPNDRRNATVIELLDRGHVERMFLSQDFDIPIAAGLDWYPPEVVEQLEAGGAVDGWSMTLLFERIIPELKEAGMTDEQLDTMLVANPPRWLGR
jgi:phosphotriesterase-related protein